MGDLTVKEIVEATGGSVKHGSPGTVFTGVSIDSRTIRKGDLFVALKGERFDGHDFLEDALRLGNGALVSTAPAEVRGDKTLILVKDSLAALQDIARYVRTKGIVRVVGITGTNGKTTTKELTASVLSCRYMVMKNAGNLNNHIGLPLSMTEITDHDEFAVLEMGASARGDIKALCEMALPDYGVITNIGPGHLESFGSLEGVRSTKLELFDAAGTVVLNADDRFLMEGVAQRPMTAGKRIATYGVLAEADIWAKDVVSESRSSRFTLCTKGGDSVEVTLHIPGRFNIYNALAAAALGVTAGVELPEVKRGIELFRGVPMRLEFNEVGGVIVISDVYNANPASTEEAVKELARLKRKRTIAVLGDMLELGTYADEAHRRLGRWMSGLAVDVLIAVGPLMARAAEAFIEARREALSQGQGTTSQVFAVPDSGDAGRVLISLCKEGDTVLIKGSRGMQMERVVQEMSGTAGAMSSIQGTA